MNYSIVNGFIDSIMNNKKEKEITAYFKNGSSAIYTYNIVELLKEDKEVKKIIDNETGKIIFGK